MKKYFLTLTIASFICLFLLNGVSFATTVTRIVRTAGDPYDAYSGDPYPTACPATEPNLAYSWDLRRAVECPAEHPGYTKKVVFYGNYDIHLFDAIMVPNDTIIVGENYLGAARSITINSHGFLIGSQEMNVVAVDVDISKLTFDHMYASSPSGADWDCYGAAICIKNTTGSYPLYDPDAGIDIHNNTFYVAEINDNYPIWAITIDLPENRFAVEGIEIYENLFVDEGDGMEHGIKIDSEGTFGPNDDSDNVNIDINTNCFDSFPSSSIETHDIWHVLTYNNVFQGQELNAIYVNPVAELISHKNMFYFTDTTNYSAVRHNSGIVETIDDYFGNYSGSCPASYPNKVLVGYDWYCCNDASCQGGDDLLVIDANPSGIFDPDDYFYSYSPANPSGQVAAYICNNAGNPNE